MPFTTVPDKAAGDIFTEQMWDVYIRDNINWLQANLGGTVAYGTTLPASPSNGQEAILVDSTTNPTYQWRFRYNAGSSSAYKWEFIGGAPGVAYIGTQENTTTAGSWVDLATVGPTFTNPRAGDYIVATGAALNCTAVNVPVIGVAIGATTPIFSMNSATTANGWTSIAIAGYFWAGLAASSALRLRYYQTAAGTMAVTGRVLTVQPIRVS
jgi:hypothetical protein